MPVLLPIELLVHAAQSLRNIESDVHWAQDVTKPLLEAATVYPLFQEYQPSLFQLSQLEIAHDVQTR